MLRVAIIAQSAMGGGVARRLSSHGFSMLTCLEERSPANLTRAAAVGMQAVTPKEPAQGDILLSVPAI